MVLEKEYIVNNINNGVTFTAANRKAVEKIFDLSTLCETLISTDGIKPIMRRIRVELDTVKSAALNDSGGYSIVPLIVQTAGTITDTVDINNGKIDIILDGVIDDEFGYQKITDTRMAKLIAFGNATSYIRRMILRFDIPRNVINLLNKEVSTERLQSIWLVLLIIGHNDAGLAIDISGTINVHFKEVSKGITIR